MIDILKNLGRQVKDCRKSKNWSQYKLADESELSRWFIYRFEKGDQNISLKSLYNIATQLNIDLYKLFLQSPVRGQKDYNEISNIQKVIGERIRYLRDKKNWSQHELGERTNLGRTYINALENGNVNPTIDTLLNISNQLTVEIYQIFIFGDENL